MVGGAPEWHANEGGWEGVEEDEDEEEEAAAAMRVPDELSQFQNEAATWLLGSSGNTGTYISTL